MQEEPRKNANGQWVAINDEIKKSLDKLLNSSLEYAGSLSEIGDIVDFFISNKENTKAERVPIEKAEGVLKAISRDFNEKTDLLKSTLGKISENISELDTTVSGLSTEKFMHRIEKFQEAKERLETHIQRFEKQLLAVEEQKKVKLEEAKAAIMREHRAGFCNKLQ